jgi:hypothetical protein
MRYSTSGEQYLETYLMLDIEHQLLLINRHTPPLLVLPDVAVPSCRCMENPANSILSVSLFSHGSVKHKISQFLMSRWQDSLDRAYPVNSPVIARWPIERIVEVGYPLTNKFSQFGAISAPCTSVFSLCEWWGFGPGLWETVYPAGVGLIKEKIFVQIEVSKRCSDIHRLFSIIRDGSSNIMYKICYKQCEKKHRK